MYNNGAEDPPDLLSTPTILCTLLDFRSVGILLLSPLLLAELLVGFEGKFERVVAVAAAVIVVVAVVLLSLLNFAVSAPTLCVLSTTKTSLLLGSLDTNLVVSGRRVLPELPLPITTDEEGEDVVAVVPLGE